MNPNDEVASLIRGLLGSGLSHIEIARRTGVGRGQLWRIESGATREPHLSTYAKIARVYRSHVGDLPPLKLR